MFSEMSNCVTRKIAVSHTLFLKKCQLL